MINIVVLSRRVQKNLRGVPDYIVINLQKWVDDIEQRGVEEVRKVKSYHDEPLRGKRKGQRSIRLTRAYRAIYFVHRNRKTFIEVKEVHKHAY